MRWLDWKAHAHHESDAATDQDSLALTAIHVRGFGSDIGPAVRCFSMGHKAAHGRHESLQPLALLSSGANAILV